MRSVVDRNVVMRRIPVVQPGKSRGTFNNTVVKAGKLLVEVRTMFIRSRNELSSLLGHRRSEDTLCRSQLQKTKAS